MKQAISTDGAPRAIGPYSQAVRSGKWLFLSGQIALDPSTGMLVGPDDVAAQTIRVMENLKAVLAAAGAGLDSVVKTTLYLVDLGDFAVVNTLYERYLTPPFPARATVQVAALPRGARVEIEAVARLPV
ncbi:MAG: Rid family detoxifying hydrolase [Magnetococcus sp. WYHC-3]